MTPSKSYPTDLRTVLQQALLVGDNPDDPIYRGVDSQQALDELETATRALRNAHRLLVRIAGGARAAHAPALANALREAIDRDLVNPANQLALSDLAHALAAHVEAPSEEG